MRGLLHMSNTSTRLFIIDISAFGTKSVFAVYYFFYLKSNAAVGVPPFMERKIGLIVQESLSSSVCSTGIST